MVNLMDFAQNKPMVLIVEDEFDLADMVSKRLARSGFDFCIADTITEGLELNQKYKPEVIILDVNLPDGSSLKSVDKFLDVEGNPPPSIILTTSESNAKVSELFDMIAKGKIKSYIQKIYSMDELAQKVIEESEKRKTQPQSLVKKAVTNAISQELRKEKLTFVAKSPAMMKVKNHITSLAKVFAASRGENASALTPVIFISGETGTGKSALAEYFQTQFPDSKYMALDSTQLTSELIASELFGAVKGAYTGADTKKDRQGILEDIGDGILFFDEIGDLNQDLQSRLLMPIQHRSFRPVGSTQNKTFNGIILCATNKNLDLMVEEGTFRSDLYHRIKTHEFVLPPLRERLEDIPDIANQYLEANVGLYKLPELSLDESAIDYLCSYKWPGNIRELQNTLHKLMMQYVTGEIDTNVTKISAEMLSSVLKFSQTDTTLPKKKKSDIDEIITKLSIKPTKDQIKRYSKLVALMEKQPGTTLRQAALKLRISYSTAHHTYTLFQPKE
jgi:DNA-binding NtrC family response regulator